MRCASELPELILEAGSQLADVVVAAADGRRMAGCDGMLESDAATATDGVFCCERNFVSSPSSAVAEGRRSLPLPAATVGAVVMVKYDLKLKWGAIKQSSRCHSCSELHCFYARIN